MTSQAATASDAPNRPCATRNITISPMPVARPHRIDATVKPSGTFIFLMASAGVDVATSTPEEFGALLRSEFDRWGKVVRETGATVN